MDDEMKYIRGLFLDRKFMNHILDMRQQGVAVALDKCAQKSAEFRKDGDQIFIQNKKCSWAISVIFNFYCKSIACAPLGSIELALAYASRSAILFNLKKHESCISDIDRALKIRISDALKNKLISRRARCEIALKSLKSVSVANKLSDDKIKNNSTIKKESQEIKRDEKEDYSEELIDIFKSIDIRYSAKHGRQLVALQDFKPGEVIFSEKVYTPYLRFDKLNTHCSHCLTFCWSTIPCENCSWAMFCSEECKKIAAEKYHHIECSIVTLINSFGYPFAHHFRMTIRSIVLAIKDAGSIEKLKEEVRHVDESKDMCWRGIKHKDQFLKNKFSIMYGAAGLRFSSSFNDENREGIMLLLLSLMELIPVLKRKIRRVDIKNLRNDSDIIFIGSLITKILKTQVMCSYDTLGKKCRYSKDTFVCMITGCCIEGGSGFAPISSLIKHNCYPNISRCITKDQRIIIYAIHPIKKDAEISYSYCGGFDVQHRVIRQKYLDTFQLTCDCLACKHDWLPYATLSEKDQEAMMNRMKSWEKEIYMKYNSLLCKEPVDEVNIDGAIQALTECITRLFKEGKKPSILLIISISSLKFYFSKKYNYDVPFLLEECLKY